MESEEFMVIFGIICIIIGFIVSILMLLDLLMIQLPSHLGKFKGYVIKKETRTQRNGDIDILYTLYIKYEIGKEFVVCHRDIDYIYEFQRRLSEEQEKEIVKVEKEII